MSYLLDRRNKKRRFWNGIFLVCVLLILFYFRRGVYSGLSYIVSGVFHPIISSGNSTGGKFHNWSAYFMSKNTLLARNQELQQKLDEASARMINYSSVLDENTSLKKSLGRIPTNRQANTVIAAILSKPNQSAYDTLVIDAGSAQGLREGNTVFALGDLPIGQVSLVYENTSRVTLFSTSGVKTEVVIGGSNTYLPLVGRGGGNFEMVMPKDFTVKEGDQALLPGLTPYVVAVAQTIISDPRDPFTKALLRSPVNVQELKFVEVLR